MPQSHSALRHFFFRPIMVERRLAHVSIDGSMLMGSATNPYASKCVHRTPFSSRSRHHPPGSPEIRISYCHKLRCAVLLYGAFRVHQERESVPQQSPSVSGGLSLALLPWQVFAILRFLTLLPHLLSDG